MSKKSLHFTQWHTFEQMANKKEVNSIDRLLKLSTKSKENGFNLQWKHIANALKHELYEKISSDFLLLVNGKEGFENLDALLTKLKKKTRISGKEMNYIKQLFERAKLFEFAVDEKGNGVTDGIIDIVQHILKIDEELNEIFSEYEYEIIAFMHSSSIDERLFGSSLDFEKEIRRHFKGIKLFKWGQFAQLYSRIKEFVILRVADPLQTSMLFYLIPICFCIYIITQCPLLPMLHQCQVYVYMINVAPIAINIYIGAPLPPLPASGAPPPSSMLLYVIWGQTSFCMYIVTQLHCNQLHHF